MQIIEDELAEIFDAVEILPYIKVKKVITDEGEKIVVIGKGDLDKCIPILTEIEDKRTPKPKEINAPDWYTTGYVPTMISDSSADVIYKYSTTASTDCTVWEGTSTLGC